MEPISGAVDHDGHSCKASGERGAWPLVKIRIPVGAYVKRSIKNTDDSFFDDDDFGELIRDDKDGCPYLVLSLSGGMIGETKYHETNAIEVITETNTAYKKSCCGDNCVGDHSDDGKCVMCFKGYLFISYYFISDINLYNII